MEDRIDDFLMGKMSSDESSRFIEEQMNDPDLASRIELRRKIIIGFSEVYEEELKQKLIAYDRSLGTTKRLKKITLIAASILIILVAGTTLVQLTKKETFDSFDFFEAGIPNKMSVTITSQEFQQGMNAFKLEDYQTASETFKDLAKKIETSNDTLNYYLGVSEFRLEKYELSALYFEQVLNEKLSSFNEKATYRYALSLIAQDKLKEGEKVLNEIMANENHSMNKYAIKVLNTFYDK